MLSFCFLSSSKEITLLTLQRHLQGFLLKKQKQKKKPKTNKETKKKKLCYCTKAKPPFCSHWLFKYMSFSQFISEQISVPSWRIDNINNSLKLVDLKQLVS